MGISKSTVFSLLALIAILVGIPLAIFSYEAHRSGQSLTQYLKKVARRMQDKEGKSWTESAPRAVRAEKIEFLQKIPIGDPVGDTKPWITHLKIVDLDDDGLELSYLHLEDVLKDGGESSLAAKVANQ